VPYPLFSKFRRISAYPRVRVKYLLITPPPDPLRFARGGILHTPDLGPRPQSGEDVCAEHLRLVVQPPLMEGRGFGHHHVAEAIPELVQITAVNLLDLGTQVGQHLTNADDGFLMVGPVEFAVLPRKQADFQTVDATPGLETGHVILVGRALGAAVCRVESSQLPEYPGEVLNRTRQRTGHVERPAHRRQTAAAHPTRGRAQP